MTLVLVDIDGTLADITPRLSAAGLEPSREDRAAFQRWLDTVQNEQTLAQDRPVHGMLSIVSSLDYGTRIIYLTGRSEKYRSVTEQWLDKHGFPPGPLYMREEGDWRSAASYKESVVEEIREHDCPGTMVAIDDDGAGDCAEMYIRNGITHLKVINKWSVG